VAVAEHGEKGDGRHGGELSASAIDEPIGGERVHWRDILTEKRREEKYHCLHAVAALSFSTQDAHVNSMTSL
jgi:hypothetical protein